jgi:hypothetical protein
VGGLEEAAQQTRWSGKLNFDYSKLTNEELTYLFDLEVGYRQARRSISLLVGEFVEHVHDNMFTLVRNTEKISRQETANFKLLDQAMALRTIPRPK